MPELYDCDLCGHNELTVSQVIDCPREDACGFTLAELERETHQAELLKRARANVGNCPACRLFEQRLTNAVMSGEAYLQRDKVLLCFFWAHHTIGKQRLYQGHILSPAEWTVHALRQGGWPDPDVVAVMGVLDGLGLFGGPIRFDNAVQATLL